MMIATVPHLARLAIFLLAGVGAGIANGIVGGGTFISFPTLLAMGVPALQANMTAAVGVVPSYLGGIRGFRAQLAPHRELIRSLLPSTVLGAATGCALLLRGSPSQFQTVVPWLVGAATVLFALAPVITRRFAHVKHTHAGRRWSLFAGIFVASAYGSYFGAGLGILLLAIMAISLPLDIYELQGLRNVLSIVINLLAAVVFVIHGDLAWGAVYMLLAGTLIGGWLGTLLIRRLSPTTVRVLIIAAGVVTTVRLSL